LNNSSFAGGAQLITIGSSGHSFWRRSRHSGTRLPATGFPRVFYLRYHGYAKFFPLWALARYRNLKSGNVRAVGCGM
jgi:squalene-hopene/tetraprenyl-beta-curcumene cyclase